MLQSLPNLLWAEWISFSASVSLFGLLTLYCSSFVPEALQRVFRYGKTAEPDSESARKVEYTLEIPKKWFYHFYVFASVFYVLLLWSVYRVYVTGDHVPPFLQLLLDSFVGSHRRTTVSGESVLLAMILLQIQVSRRLYECTQLSIYSDGKMALVHYLCGFSFYFGVGLSLLAEADGFTTSGASVATSGGDHRRLIDWSDFLSVNHVIGCALFLFSSVVQFKSHVILAKLRKDSKGRVVTLKHSIPRGDWFELVSCPHYFAEILIYLSLSLVLSGQSTTWWMVCSFVAANQIIVGLFNHHWYLEHFQDYPKQRKAILPFVI